MEFTQFSLVQHTFLYSASTISLMRYSSNTSVSILEIKMFNWCLKQSNASVTTLNNPVRHSSRLDQRHWTHGCRRLTVCSVLWPSCWLIVTDRRPPSLPQSSLLSLPPIPLELGPFRLAVLGEWRNFPPAGSAAEIVFGAFKPLVATILMIFPKWWRNVVVERQSQAAERRSGWI